MVNNYVFMTDSDSDLPFSFAEERNIPVVKMPYTLDDVEYLDDNGKTGQEKILFKRMREGSVPITSLLPTATYLEYFEPILKDNDLLFVAFSSNMSNTIQNVFEAREELLKKYPERKFIVVDTLSISAPMTLLVKKAHDLYFTGASMEEVEKWIMDNRLKSHAWLTVEDLVYLKRGGRITSTSAFFGSMLDIKPILALGKSGKIEPEAKVQGRKKALRTLVERAAQNIENPADQEIIILHGDCLDQAETLKEMLVSQIPEAKNITLQMIGPVIGAHCGPGTLAVCFMGKERPI
ncbi:MAG: DegV family protein [Christensenellaceae bacterium]|nr:DegV family protein [Christensenellaceae bacterium]